MGTLGVDYQIALREQLVGHSYCRFERTAAVATQVEHQMFHALLEQLLQSLVELGAGGLRKTGNMDIACLAVNHHRGGDGGMLNDVTAYFHLSGGLPSRTVYCQGNIAETGSADEVYHGLRPTFQFHSRHLHSVHHQYTVACNNTGAPRRAVLPYIGSINGIVENKENYPDAFKPAMEQFCLFVVILY